MEDIEPGTPDLAAPKPFDQRRLVDERAARGVDQDHAAFHAGDARGIDDAARLVVEREIERNDIGTRQQGIEVDERHAIVRAWRPVPGDHLHANAACDPRNLAADAAESNDAERLAIELHAFERAPMAGAHAAVHAHEPARAGKHQRNGVLGHRNVAVALDGVHGHAQSIERRHVHVARGAGAEEHDVAQCRALRHQLGRHIGMVVDADVIAGEHTRQLGALERRRIHHDWGIVGPVDAGKHRVKLIVAVDEDRFHVPFRRLAFGNYDMAKRNGMEGSRMPAGFQGKIVVISGGSRGIGRGIATAFAHAGAQCVIASSSADNLAAAAKAIAAEGPEPLTIAADLRELSGCEQVFARVKERFGRCDILVNNAGRTRAGNFLDLPDDAFLDGFALKYFGAVRLTRLFWPLLKAAQGHVVNIVGGAARSPEPEFMIGSSVNAAVANFSKGLSKLGMRDGVNVNVIHPGNTATERQEELLAQRAAATDKTVEELRAAALAKSGVRRVGRVEDIAALTLFLCSEEARQIQGTAVAVDGGATVGYY